MTCSFEQKTIPPLPTRKEVADLLELTVREVLRLDEEGFIKRHPAYGNPVRYYGWSVKQFWTGERS